MPLRIVFMGTAELASVSLRALLREPAFEMVGVVSQPDKPRGRDLRLQPTPVKAAALEAGQPVLQPARARDAAFLEELRKLAPELIVVAAYGQLLPPALLQLPRLGCLNVHTSLLPKYRGAAPIQWAILEGETETGVTIMQMDAGLDTGPILTQRTTPIDPDDNGQTLHDRLAALGAELLVATIPEWAGGRITPRPQPAEGATLARKLTKEDGLLDWSEPATRLWNRVRAFTPWPGAYTFQTGPGKPMLLKVWRAQVEPAQAGRAGEVLQADKQGIVVGCGQQSLRILELQREGSRRLTAQEFLAGNECQRGTILSPVTSTSR